MSAHTQVTWPDIKRRAQDPSANVQRPLSAAGDSLLYRLSFSLYPCYSGDLINVYKYLQGGGQEDGARLFPVVSSDRTRGNGHKLKPGKFQLNPRKNFFPLRVPEPWPRLPREVVESPSLEIFKTHLDAVLCSLLWVTLLGQGVGLGDPQRSFPTPNIL